VNNNNLEEVENKILGTYATSPDLFETCEHLISEHIFTSKSRKQIFKIIKVNHQNGITTDFSILLNCLAKLGYNKNESVDLTKGIEFDSHTQIYPESKVKILFDALIRRTMLPILFSAHQEFYSETGDVQDTLDILKNKITDIEFVINNISKGQSVKELIELAIKEIDVARKSSANLLGYSTGLTALDDITSGVCGGVTVIGGVPGCGKTTMVVHLIKEIGIIQKKPLMFFSLEMPATQIIKNLFANDLEINTKALRIGDINDNDYDRITGSAGKYNENIIIDDTPAITWQYIEAKIRKVRKNVPLSTLIVVIIDYLQVMENSADEIKGRSDEALMSIRCKKIANMWKKYNVAFIELSQLSREVNKRTPPRPRINDLKESGAIEANADQVWLLYRPDYYDNNPVDGSGNSLKGLVETGIVKNRYGKTGATYSKFIPKYSKYENYNEEGIKQGGDAVF
jgi:replicative DNA helicase